MESETSEAVERAVARALRPDGGDNLKTVFAELAGWSDEACDRVAEAALLARGSGAAYRAISAYVEVFGADRLSRLVGRRAASAALLAKMADIGVGPHPESSLLAANWSRADTAGVEAAARRLVTENVGSGLRVLAAATSACLSEIVERAVCERVRVSGEGLLEDERLLKRSLSRRPRLVASVLDLLRSSERRLSYCPVSGSWSSDAAPPLLDYGRAVRSVLILLDTEAGSGARLKTTAYARLAERRNPALWADIRSDIDRSLRL